MPGVFEPTETPDNVVSETVGILNMWDRLEYSFKELSAGDKEWLAKNAYLGNDVKFHGFDGNDGTEAKYASAASFLVDHLNRFQIFKGRDFNSHMPTLDAYRRMLPVFEPILRQVANQNFSKEQIAKVMNAYRHPDARG
jgi:uncharacterized protein YfbU (UPF0304 family)